MGNERSDDPGGTQLRRHSTRLPSAESRIEASATGSYILVTHAFCPRGHDVVAAEGLTFNGFPGITVRVRGGERSGDVTLSPLHGDHRRGGEVDFADGTLLEVTCPECATPLPRMGECGCVPGSHWVALYTTARLEAGSAILICDAWGCRRSKLIDQAELLREYV
jgi:hypothetical protein